MYFSRHFIGSGSLQWIEFRAIIQILILGQVLLRRRERVVMVKHFFFCYTYYHSNVSAVKRLSGSVAETLQMTTASIFKDLRMLLDLVRVILSVKGNSDYRANSISNQIDIWSWAWQARKLILNVIQIMPIKIIIDFVWDGSSVKL